MGKYILTKFIFGTALFAVLILNAFAQNRQTPDQELVAKRNQLEKELADVAVIDRKVIVPMRDGKRMAADIYRPKDASKKYPIIFSRTPYNFNFWDVRLGAPRDMTTVLEAVKRGYAYVVMNERGHFSQKEITIFWAHQFLTVTMRLRGCLRSPGPIKKSAQSVVLRPPNGSRRSPLSEIPTLRR